MKRRAVVSLAALSIAFGQSGEKRIEAPRVWNDHDLSDWATPVAGLNVRPGDRVSEGSVVDKPAPEISDRQPILSAVPVRELFSWLSIGESWSTPTRPQGIPSLRAYPPLVRGGTSRLGNELCYASYALVSSARSTTYLPR